MFTRFPIEFLYQLPIYILLFSIVLLMLLYCVPQLKKIRNSAPYLSFAALFLALCLFIYLYVNVFYLNQLGFTQINATSLSIFSKGALAAAAQHAPLAYHNYLHHFYVVDSYGLIYASLILIVALAVFLLLYRHLELTEKQKIALNIAFILVILGAILMIFTAHLIVFYFSLELISIPMLLLLSLKSNGRFSFNRLWHSWITSFVASSFFLLGVALYYAHNHELTFAGVSFNLANNEQSTSLGMIGLSFMFLSILFKLGLAPIQHQFINQVQNLTYPIVLLILTVVSVALFCCISRLFLISTIVNNETIKIVIMIVAACSIIYGNMGAIYQKNVNLILSYLSISLWGYLLIPFIAMQYDIYVLETLMICLIGNILAFIVLYTVLLIESKIQNHKMMISHLTGLIKKRPLNAIMMMIALLSLAHIPLTLGFIGHFFLILSAVTAQLWFFVLLFIFSTMTGLYLCLKLIILLFKHEQHVDEKPLAISNPLQRFKINESVAILATGLLIFFGLFPQSLLKLAEMSIV